MSTQQYSTRRLLPNQTGRYQVAADRVHSEYIVLDTATATELAWHPLSPAGYQAAYEAANRLNTEEAARLAEEEARRENDLAERCSCFRAALLNGDNERPACQAAGRCPDEHPHPTDPNPDDDDDPPPPPVSGARVVWRWPCPASALQALLSTRRAA